MDDPLPLFLCWQTVNTTLGCCCLSLLSLPPWLGYSGNLCPRQAVRSLPVLLQGVLLSQLQDLASALLNFVRFLLSCASSLSGSLWMSAYLLLCQNCSSNSRVICKLLVITVITCSRLLIMVLNRIHLLVIHPDCDVLTWECECHVRQSCHGQSKWQPLLSPHLKVSSQGYMDSFFQSNSLEFILE